MTIDEHSQLYELPPRRICSTSVPTGATARRDSPVAVARSGDVDRRGCGWWEAHGAPATGDDDMPQLSDTQAILLSTAAQRDDHSLYPLPATLRRGGGLAKAIAALVKAGLAAERETVSGATTVREDGDPRFGLFATAAGLAAIGVVPDTAEPQSVAAEVAPTPPQPSVRSTKILEVLALLRREEGATLPELIAVTGWLPHTTRAALTRLRQQGYVLAKRKRGDATAYVLAEAA